MNTSTRRDFFKTSSLALGSMLLPVHLAKSASRAQDQLRIRKSANSIEATTDITLYRKAVQVMKARPAADPKSWAFQAKIHQDFCPHGNWFFLPWHRAYLKNFEEICREACGDVHFNLPYWDWTEYPQVPASFWGNGNPLLDTTREITANAIARDEFIGRDTINRIMQLTSFEDFASYRADSPRDPVNGGQGELEGTPHNYIHRFIGGRRGNMTTLLSPLDPIFWLHHANADRIWATWNDNGNANSNDTAFNNFILKGNFYNTTGKVDVRIGDILDVRRLGYAYDTQRTIQPVIANSKFKFNTLQLAALSNTKLIKKLTPARFELASETLFTEELKTKLQSNAPIQQGAQTIKVVLSDITPPPDEDFFVRVFINCDYLDKNTPINDPHYAGSFTFFASTHEANAGMQGMDHSMHDKKLKFVMDVTDTLSKVVDVSSIDSIADKIRVQLLSVPLNDSSAAALLPGKIEIVVASRED